ncbi:MAG: ABC transporter permease [Anaerolineae bacterium]|nr:ABC transporter permease [Anaerolineae bacterium]
MTYLIRALHAEILKTRHTLAFWLTLIAPAVIVTLLMLTMLANLDLYYNRASEYDAWFEYGGQILLLWGLLMLPLFVTLETALVGQLEHNGNQWTHIFALPIPRGVVYAAKQLSGTVLIGLSIINLVGLLIISGVSMRFLAPGLGFEAAIPWLEFTKFGLTMFLGAGLIITIHTWVAQRWSSFVIASGVGIAMTIVGVIVIQSDYANFYPWTLPIIVASGFASESMRGLNGFTEGLPFIELAFGCLGGVIAALIGGRNFIRQDVL